MIKNQIVKLVELLNQLFLCVVSMVILAKVL